MLQVLYTNAIKKAQQKVEQFHFDARKNLLKFDDVMNEQRKVIFNQRKDLMNAENVHDMLLDMRHEIIEDTVNYFIPPKSNLEELDLDGLRAELARVFAMELPITEIMKKDDAEAWIPCAKVSASIDFQPVSSREEPFRFHHVFIAPLS